LSFPRSSILFPKALAVTAPSEAAGISNAGGDGLSLAKTGRVLGAKSNVSSDRELARIVAKALREDFGDMASAIKQIGHITTANLNTVTNWYQAKNVPSSRHLLVLARSSPGILRLVLMQIGGEDLWDAFQLFPGKRTPEKAAFQGEPNAHKEVVADGTINVTINSLNARQTWFLSELRQAPRTDAVSIADKWDINIRTARRDIAGLQNRKLVIYRGAKRNGHYILREQPSGDN
jgi:hypothetical protein